MKKKTLLKIAAACVLIVGALALFGSTLVPPVYTIRSEIILPTDIDKSWEVLTDFSSYPEWNPYLLKVNGTLAPGETVTFTLVDGNFSAPMDLTARVAHVQPNEQFYWVGTLGLQGLHDTRHVFELQALPDGITQLLHFEEFRGLLPWLLPKREERIALTRKAFESMNKALQERLGQQNN